jgi:Ca2+-binding EF-hand superfamily protein
VSDSLVSAEALIVFQRLDKNRDGRLSLTEFLDGRKDIGSSLDLTIKQCMEYYELLDRDKSFDISYSEFELLWKAKKVFQEMDSDKSKVDISPRDFF